MADINNCKVEMNPSQNQDSGREKERNDNNNGNLDPTSLMEKLKLDDDHDEKSVYFSLDNSFAIECVVNRSDSNESLSFGSSKSFGLAETMIIPTNGGGDVSSGFVSASSSNISLDFVNQFEPNQLINGYTNGTGINSNSYYEGPGLYYSSSTMMYPGSTGIIGGNNVNPTSQYEGPAGQDGQVQPKQMIISGNNCVNGYAVGNTNFGAPGSFEQQRAMIIPIGSNGNGIIGACNNTNVNFGAQPPPPALFHPFQHMIIPINNGFVTENNASFSFAATGAFDNTIMNISVNNDGIASGIASASSSSTSINFGTSDLIHTHGMMQVPVGNEITNGFASASSSNTSLVVGAPPISTGQNIPGFFPMGGGLDFIVQQQCFPAPEGYKFPELYEVGELFYHQKIGQIPYVSNDWTENGKALLRTCASKYTYFVPPRVADTDYFGGQLRIFALKFYGHFRRFQPDIWLLQALPELRHPNTFGRWYQNNMTCKLRYACRECNKPWTSMRGKIVFFFKLDQFANRGFIYMKVFGQVCNQEGCADKGFQTPACYPEEVEKVLFKLSQFIGCMFYNQPVSREIITGYDRAHREGHPKTAHARELCQACAAGVCSYGVPEK